MIFLMYCYIRLANIFVDKTAMVHLHNGILFDYQKEENVIFDSMAGPGEYYAK